MADKHTPRRPAMLDAEQAESIPGAEDGAASSQVAHMVAQTLIGIQKEQGEDVVRLRELFAKGNIEAVSELWSSSPATTLPGTFWRLYLVHQWYLRDPRLIQTRFITGARAARPGSSIDPDSVREALDRLMKQVDSLWMGQASIELPTLLSRVADLLGVLAGGVSAQWIEDANDPLADPVTLRPAALLNTATELMESARKARANNLD